MCVAASVWVRGGMCPPAGSAGPVRSSTTSPSMWRAARSWASWATQVGTQSKEPSNKLEWFKGDVQKDQYLMERHQGRCDAQVLLYLS